MPNTKKKIYDDIYGKKKLQYETSKGIIAFLYKRLSKFEKNRYQVCYNLLPNGGENLLDVGCGDGRFLFMAKDKFNECFGIDISPLRIQHAREKAKERSDGENFHFYEHDVDEGLPFHNSVFDAVSCIAVLEHVFNPPNVVEEVYRVLKPGGIFVVQVPNFAWLPNRFQLLVGRLPTTGGVYLGADWEHLHNFTKSTLCRLITAKKFEIEDILCSGIFANYRKRKVSALGGDLITKSRKIQE